MRMVYRLLGIPLPQKVRSSLANGGCDMSEYFPIVPNFRPGPYGVSSLLGAIELKHHATDEKLRGSRSEVKKKALKEADQIAELSENLMQAKKELESVRAMLDDAYKENVKLKRIHKEDQEMIQN